MVLQWIQNKANIITVYYNALFEWERCTEKAVDSFCSWDLIVMQIRLVAATCAANLQTWSGAASQVTQVLVTECRQWHSVPEVRVVVVHPFRRGAVFAKPDHVLPRVQLLVQSTWTKKTSCTQKIMPILSYVWQNNLNTCIAIVFVVAACTTAPIIVIVSVAELACKGNRVGAFYNVIMAWIPGVPAFELVEDDPVQTSTIVGCLYKNYDDWDSINFFFTGTVRIPWQWIVPSWHHHHLMRKDSHPWSRRRSSMTCKSYLHTFVLDSKLAPCLQECWYSLDYKSKK